MRWSLLVHPCCRSSTKGDDRASPGQALGVTEQVPGEERHNFNQAYLKARLAVMLGGRTAEEIAIGEITTGAENDLVEATRLARRMVTRWGMAKLGPIAFRVDEQQPFLGYELSQRPDYSEATAAEIDGEVRRLLEEAARKSGAGSPMRASRSTVSLMLSCRKKRSISTNSTGF